MFCSFIVKLCTEYESICWKNASEEIQGPMLYQWTVKHWCQTVTSYADPVSPKYQPVLTHTDPVPPNTSQYRPILTQYHHISMSLAIRSLATMSLTTIVPHYKFYNRLKHKKPRIIIQIRDLRCLLGLVSLLLFWFFPRLFFRDHIFRKQDFFLRPNSPKPKSRFSFKSKFSKT